MNIALNTIISVNDDELQRAKVELNIYEINEGRRKETLL